MSLKSKLGNLKGTSYLDVRGTFFEALVVLWEWLIVFSTLILLLIIVRTRRRELVHNKDWVYKIYWPWPLLLSSSPAKFSISFVYSLSLCHLILAIHISIPNHNEERHIGSRHGPTSSYDRSRYALFYSKLYIWYNNLINCTICSYTLAQPPRSLARRVHVYALWRPRFPRCRRSKRTHRILRYPCHFPVRFLFSIQSFWKSRTARTPAESILRIRRAQFAKPKTVGEFVVYVGPRA